MVELKSGEVLDDLGYHGLRIIQHGDKFKFTIDAFLLARFVNAKPEDRLLDLGTGGGILPLLLAGEAQVGQVIGVELQPELAEMAARSVRLNGLEAQIKIIQTDLREFYKQASLNSFDIVISNPPYYPVGQGVVSQNNALAIAKFEVECTLTDWVRASSRLVRGNGRVAVIFPSGRLAELLVILEQYHLTPKRMCLVYSRPHNDSNLVLVESRPGAKPGLQVLPPLYIYDQLGQYTETMNQIFHGERI